MPSIDGRNTKPKHSSSKNSIDEASNDDTFDADSFVVRRILPAPEGEESSVVKFDTSVKKPQATATTSSNPKLTLPTMSSSSKHKSSSRGSSGSGGGSGVTGKSNTSSSRETPVASNNNDRSSRHHHRSTPDYSDNDDDTTSLAELTSYGSSHADLHPHHKQRRSTKESTHQGEESDMDREGGGRHSSSRHRSSGRDDNGGRDKSANRRRKAGHRNSDTEDDYGNETEDSSAHRYKHRHSTHGRTSRSSRSRGSTSSVGGGGILSTLTSPFTLVWSMFEGINLKTVLFCMMGVALILRMESVHHQGQRALGSISGSSPLIRDPVEIGNPGIRGATVPTVVNADDNETEDNDEGGHDKEDSGEEGETKESDEGGETIELGNDIEGEDDMAEQPPPPPAEDTSYSQPMLQEPMEQQPMEQQPMEEQVGAVNQVQQYDPQQQQAGSMNQAQQFSAQQQQFSPQQQQFSPQQQQQQGAFPHQQQQFDPQQQQQQQQIQGQYPAVPQVQQPFVQANGMAAAVPGSNPAFASGGVAFPQQQQMIQTGQIDPQTGQPMAQQIDPQTGQPVAQQIDPQTGQPVLQQFDPQTGQMVQSMPQQNTGMGVPGAGAVQSPLEWQQQQQLQQQQQGQTPMDQQQLGGAMGLDPSQQMQQQPPQQQVDQFGSVVANASSQMSPQQDAQMGQPQQQQVDQFGNAAVDASSQPQEPPPQVAQMEQQPQEATGQVVSVDPAAPAGDAAVALPASGSPQESVLGLLSNFKDTWDPYDETDIPMFWHIPKAGGSSIKDTMGGCHRFVQATEFGVTDGHGAETEVAIVYPAVPGVADTDRSPFVNIDSTTVAGIARAKQMGFADANLAQLVVSPFVFETNDLFTPTAHGRLFSVFRHPIERAVSMFYYIQVADWEPSYKPELKDWTMEQYATSDIVENNWMTRQLSNQLGGELTEENLNKAMEVVRTKFLVGLMSQIERTMSRVEKFFRMTYHVNPTNQEACRNRLMSGGSNSNSKNKKPFTEEDPAWALLAHQNNFDMPLYSYIELLFEEQDAFVEGIQDEFRKIDGTCCKCDPPTFPPEGFTCPQAVKNQ